MCVVVRQSASLTALQGGWTAQGMESGSEFTDIDLSQKACSVVNGVLYYGHSVMLFTGVE